jgi:hypothetical protein
MADNKADALELWARDCLAKAAYCEFAEGVAVDGSYREWLQTLAAEWKRAAKEGPEEKESPLRRHKGENSFFRAHALRSRRTNSRFCRATGTLNFSIASRYASR